MLDRKALGKKSRAAGTKFELKVRKDLLEQGWIVDKFSNNIDLDTNMFVAAKSKYIPGRGVMPGSGFPDFVCFKKNSTLKEGLYQLKFVEAKITGILDKEEKLKLNVLLKQGHTIYIAYEENKEVRYREFVEYTERNRLCGKNTGDKA